MAAEVYVPENLIVTDQLVDDLIGLETKFYQHTRGDGEHDHRTVAAVFGVSNESLNEDERKEAYATRIKSLADARQLVLLQRNGETEKTGVSGYAIIEPYSPRLLSTLEKVGSWLSRSSYVLTALFIESGVVDDDVQTAQLMLDKLAEKRADHEGLRLHFLRRGQSQNPLEKVARRPLRPLTDKDTLYSRFAEQHPGVKSWRRTAEFPVAHDRFTTEISNAVVIK